MFLTLYKVIAAQVDDVLVVARKRDEELARLRENAQYAGEADPYKHKEEAADSYDESDDFTLTLVMTLMMTKISI